jgi:hypothetical protein
MAVVGESGVGVQVGVPIGESLVYVGQEAGRVMLRRFVGRMGNAVDCGGAVGGGVGELQGVAAGVRVVHYSASVGTKIKVA